MVFQSLSGIGSAFKAVLLGELEAGAKAAAEPAIATTAAETNFMVNTRIATFNYVVTCLFFCRDLSVQGGVFRALELVFSSS
jgi:hypothetical protein